MVPCQPCEELYGPLMFHLSGGCCDGSAPMCFRRGKVKWIPDPYPKDQDRRQRRDHD